MSKPVSNDLRSRKVRRACFLFLPPYSPDLNALEMAFSKLKGHLRKTAARTFDELCRAARNIRDLFTPTECRNFFKALYYVAE